ARAAEAELWRNLDAELATLAGAMQTGSRLRVRRALAAYHRRRLGEVRRIRATAVVLDLPANGG
ncbi:MAG TPA: hypothetical protein PLN53_09915, partial [Terricaulis sp.]|nr:hypothetical protein [Terricaulis sp.]